MMTVEVRGTRASVKGGHVICNHESSGWDGARPSSCSTTNSPAFQQSPVHAVQRRPNSIHIFEMSEQ